MGGCQSRYGYIVDMGRQFHCCGARRKKKLMEAWVCDAKANEILSGIPGRMCGNGSSSICSIFTQQGRKGTNQDAMLVWESFASQSNTTFCGVFDGHGPYGHLVARRVRDTLPTILASEWRARKEESENEDMEMERTWKDSFAVACHLMDEELRAHPAIDCFCSGTTAVTLLLQGEDLVLANVGDSRAVLATMTDNNTMEAVQLTVDLKPNLPNEAERIKQCKGRVFALEDEPEVARVWLPYDNSPGLAMARAFGDFCLKDFGLIAAPDITHRRITHMDRFIVLASDGVWDVLSNKEVIEVVLCAPTRATAARALVETAVRAWKLKYPTSKVDDCAVICLFFDHAPLHLPINDPSKRSTTDSAIVHTAATYTENDNCTLLKMPEEDAIAMTNKKVQQQLKDEEEKDPQLVGDVHGEIIEDVERHSARRSLADCLSAADEEEWSALEGVTRVNSLLNLPRFMSSYMGVNRSMEGR